MSRLLIVQDSTGLLFSSKGGVWSPSSTDPTEIKESLDDFRERLTFGRKSIVTFLHCNRISKGLLRTFYKPL